MAGLLTFLGVHPQHPTPPGNPVGAWAWGWFRGVQTFLGVAPPKAGTPTVGPPDPATGTVTGSWNAHEQVGLPLTYTVSTDPANGTATVAGDGTFTYTPTETARLQASVGGPTADAFTVTIGDGLASTYESVSVAISVVADTPSAPSSATQVNGQNGAVSGTVSSTDPLDLPVTYVLKGNPVNGAVAVTSSGQFVYTATNLAQLKASVGGPTTDSFTVTASNGTFTSDAGTITVPIQALPDVPSAPTSATQVNGQNGAVSGTVSSTDPAGSPLTFSKVTGPQYGMVTVTPSGGYTYTATQAAQIASVTGGPTTDSFTVVASNGTYASGAGTITVTIPAPAPNTIIATITAGTNASGIAFSPNGSKAYVANETDNTVSVINTATNAVTTVPVGNGPLRVAVSPDGTAAYVTDFFGGTVSVINTATNAVTTIPVGANPTGVVFSPNGNTAYVASRGTGVLSVINTVTNSVTNISVGSQPFGVALSPNGSTAYVTNDLSSGTVSVVDLATKQITATVGVGSFPKGIAVSPDGSTAYVANLASSSVSVINTATHAVTNITVGTGPSGVAVSPDGSTAYVTNQNSGTVSVIDTATKTVITTFPVGTNSVGVAFSPNGNIAYVTNAGAGTVSVIYTGL
jgi:YVTN family beta-propeller protein/VCBS repeat-containing protein